MLVKSYFNKTADILTWKKCTPELLRAIISFYNNPPEGSTKIDLRYMPKMVCINAVRQLYENLKNCALPEMLAELKIQELNIQPNNGSHYADGNKPAAASFHFVPRVSTHKALIVSAVWYIFASDEPQNPDLLLILSEAAKADSRKTFEVFQKLYEQQKAQTTQVAESPNAEYIPQYRIADKRKADFMKVMYYLHQLKMFTNPDGTPAKGTKKFMQDIGKFYGEDFSNYAQHISKAKETDTYMNIFNDLRETAQKDYLS